MKDERYNKQLRYIFIVYPAQDAGVLTPTVSITIFTRTTNICQRLRFGFYFDRIPDKAVSATVVPVEPPE